MSKARLTFDIDFDNGNYTLTVNNLSKPGAGIPLPPLHKAFVHAMGNLLSTHDDDSPSPTGAEVPESVTEGHLKVQE